LDGILFSGIAGATVSNNDIFNNTGAGIYLFNTGWHAPCKTKVVIKIEIQTSKVSGGKRSKPKVCLSLLLASSTFDFLLTPIPPSIFEYDGHILI